MTEEFKIEKIFTKDRDNLEMLKQSLESKEIDEDIVPILEKFFSLPITPRESCYGHVGKNKSHLSTRSAQKIVLRAAKLAGIKKSTSCHSLRQSASGFCWKKVLTSSSRHHQIYMISRALELN